MINLTLMLHKLKLMYYRFFKGGVAYARYLGVKVGEQCHIASDVHFSSEPYLIEIGSNVALTHGVMIHTHGGGRVARRQIPDFDIFGKVSICDNAYIGSGSQIMPGVTIGEGALVAGGSIVTKSVPAGVVVAGNPAKFVCTVEEYIERNKKYNLGTKGLSCEEKKNVLLTADEEKFFKKPYIKIDEIS